MRKLLLIGLLATPLACCAGWNFRNAVVMGAIKPKVSGGGGGYDPASDASVVEWLRADTLGLSHGDSMTNWPAAIGGDASEVTNIYNLPSFLTNQINGLPAVSWNTGGSPVEFKLQFPAPITQPLRVWVVGKLGNTDTAWQPLFDGYGAGEVAFGKTSGNIWVLSGNTSDQPLGAASDDNWHIFEVVADGASSKVVIDGTTYTVPSSPGSNGMTGLSLNGYEDALYSFALITVAEIIVQSDLSRPESDVNSYLRSKYATY